MEQQPTIQKPGIPIKANVTLDEIKKIATELYDIEVVLIKELDGYDDKNYNLSDGESGGITLKIINLIDSKKPEIFEAQSLLLVHLGNNGVKCPVPVKTRNGTFFEKYTLKSGEHIIRALTFIKGIVLSKVPYSTNIFYQIGESAAQINKAMESFKHPAYKSYKSLWMLESVPEILPFLSAVKDEERKKLVTTIVEEFDKKVLPSSKILPRGLIHGDLNEQNLLVDKNDKDIYEIKAIIDYGDSHIGCYLYELAITMTYMMLLANDIEVGGYVFAGYSSIRSVSDAECSLIKLCVAARLCQSLVLGAYTNQQDPSNTYVLATSVNGWQLLDKIWNEADQVLLKKWRGVVHKKIS